MDKFSIILPVRNGGKYIMECINSILSQTLQNFDLLILDNKSDDGTSEWLATLKNSRIKIFPSKKPLTIEENWKRSVYIPKNQFITLIGHDDLLDKHYLAEMEELIKKHPDASLYQSHFRFINDKGSELKKCRSMRSFYDSSELLKAILTDSLDTMGTGYMMRAKDYDKLGGIPPYPNLLFADHTLWISLASLSYMAVSDKECFSYRINQSVSKLSGASKYIDAFFLFLDFLVSQKEKNSEMQKAIDSTIPAYIHTYCRSLAHRLLKTPLNQRNSKTVCEFIEKCKEEAIRLSPKNDFHPMKDPGIRIAKLIDNNLLLRNLYLLFRQFYSKPFYS
ncbi:MAG: glycosyltransferase family 2 protein [Agriterribacter sp.]